MASFGEITFSHDDVRYELNVDLDLTRSSDAVLFTTLIARVIREEEEPYEVEVQLEVRLDDRLAIVRLPTGSTVEFVIPEVNADWPAGEEGTYPPGTPTGAVARDPDPAYEAVAADLHEDLIELVAELPLGDPLACLVKAGVTSLVGQALICREVTGGGLRGILGCMRDHISGIGRHTAIRTLRCMLI